MPKNVNEQERRLEQNRSPERVDTPQTAVRPNDIAGYPGIQQDREKLVVNDAPVERTPQLRSADTPPSNVDADKMVHAGENLTDPSGNNNPTGSKPLEQPKVS